MGLIIVAAPRFTIGVMEAARNLTGSARNSPTAAPASSYWEIAAGLRELGAAMRFEEPRLRVLVLAALYETLASHAQAWRSH
jgi:hypothetical protein